MMMTIIKMMSWWRWQSHRYLLLSLLCRIISVETLRTSIAPVLPNWNSDSKTQTLNLRLWNSDSESQTLNLRLWNSDSETQTPNLRLWISDSETQTLKLRLWNSDSESQTLKLRLCSVMRTTQQLTCMTDASRRISFRQPWRPWCPFCLRCPSDFGWLHQYILKITPI